MLGVLSTECTIAHNDKKNQEKLIVNQIDHEIHMGYIASSQI